MEAKPKKSFYNKERYIKNKDEIWKNSREKYRTQHNNDLENNFWERLELIKKEIDRLVNLGRSQLYDTILAIQEIADNNVKVSMKTLGKNIHVSG